MLRNQKLKHFSVYTGMKCPQSKNSIETITARLIYKYFIPDSNNVIAVSPLFALTIK